MTNELTALNIVYGLKSNLLRHMSKIVAGENVRIGLRWCDSSLTVEEIQKVIEQQGGWFLKSHGTQGDCTIEFDYDKLRSRPHFPEFPHDDYLNQLKRRGTP